MQTAMAIAATAGRTTSRSHRPSATDFFGDRPRRVGADPAFVRPRPEAALGFRGAFAASGVFDPVPVAATFVPALARVPSDFDPDAVDRDARGFRAFDFSLGTAGLDAAGLDAADDPAVAVDSAAAVRFCAAASDAAWSVATKRPARPASFGALGFTFPTMRHFPVGLPTVLPGIALAILAAPHSYRA